MQAFHDGDVRFLICTDLAARGLDIKGLPFVINMTLPDESEHYIHRIGAFEFWDVESLPETVHALKALACRKRVAPASSPAARVRHSSRLRSTLAAAPGLLAHALVTKQ